MKISNLEYQKQQGKIDMSHLKRNRAKANNTIQYNNLAVPQPASFINLKAPVGLVKPKPLG